MRVVRYLDDPNNLTPEELRAQQIMQLAQDIEDAVEDGKKLKFTDPITGEAINFHGDGDRAITYAQRLRYFPGRKPWEKPKSDDSDDVEEKDWATIDQ